MVTFVVHLPNEEVHRLGMFSRDSLRVLDEPKGLVSLSRERTVVLVEARFRMIAKLARMFPAWRFQALLG